MRTRPRPRSAAADRRRLFGVLAVIAVAFGGISARLVDVQALSRDRYQSLGEAQRRRTVTLSAQRGSIFDRNGNDLAVSVRRETIYADPRVVRDVDAYTTTLAPVVGIDAGTLRNRLTQPGSAFTYIARQVEPAVVAQVRALELPGIGFLPESKRYYPMGELARPLIGFVGIDSNGLGGLEFVQNSVLAGKSGQVSVERDPVGNELPNTAHQLRAARRGDDLVLTIDASIQHEAESALIAGVTEARAQGGMAIVADVRTGDILAMATVDRSPVKDTTTSTSATAPATGVKAPSVAASTAPHVADATSSNRPLTAVFEPGSTAKVVTIAAAVEAGLVTTGTVLDVPQRIMVDGTKYEDEELHPGQLTVAEVLRESSNVGTIQIARMLGATQFDAALRSFGFGRTTGLDYPGEAPGILLPVARYNATSLASMPIGNGIAVTAMQMLDVYMTLASGGVARQPRLIAATIDEQGVRHPAPPSPTRTVLSAQTAKAMIGMLEGVVREGTGVKAQIPGYRVAGKTGTARKPPYDKPPYRYVSSFVGFAPADAPRLATIVVLDEPQTSIFGGQVSAPVFSRIMAHALRVEHVPPSGT